ncbi:MAG TPA: hypothetical protein VN784_03115 [Candidatus Limnocylindrales bacterium]|nr:hypothetical protein [Candidatus Limnocylindrales bacterium]
MRNVLQPIHRLVSCLFVAVAVARIADSARAEVQDAEQLAQRFRPYYKFSVHGNSQEPCHPCSWQWFAAHSDLFRGKTRIATADQLRNEPRLILSVQDGNILSAKNPTGPLKLVPGVGAAAGEPWEDVIDTGAGLYAQVEDAGNNFVILTYWSLFAFNRSTMVGTLVGANHTGDITAVVLVYDRARDQLVRAFYGLHGSILESFDLAGATVVGEKELFGHRTDGGKEYAEAKVIRVAPNRRYENGPIYYRPAEPSELYLVKDPQSKRFEHLAVFCEWGSHEPWPNPHGSVPFTPSHNGNGISFLPKSVRFLGAFSNPVEAEAPFVLFNGYWGNVPKGIIFHRSCFYPAGRAHSHFKIPEDSFVDRDPFGEGTLQWPPL